MNKVHRVKEFLWLVAMFGLVALVLRTFLGLGATTNLTDAMPWGLWKIFNMVAGVALATGGFTMACIVYVFHLKKYQSLVRPAIAIAFLGYGVSAFSLMWDIGLPYRIWHPILPSMWNPHSFLFEVAWCVMLYFTVSFVELSATISEKSPWHKVAQFLHRISVPVVILGITLSTLHHSSLGSLFLVAPGRLHPLWYTGDWIPFQFFVSAVGGGMMTVVLVALLYAYLYNKQPDLAAVQGTAFAAAAALLVFFFLRVGELTAHHKWGLVFSGQWESFVFGVELLLEVVLPVGLVAVPRVRRSAWGLAAAAAIAMLGLVMQRIDTGITGFVRWLDTPYFPSLTEFAFSAGVYAAAGLMFMFLVERFDVFEKVTWGRDEKVEGDFTRLWWDVVKSVPARISLLVVLAVPIAVLVFSTNALQGFPLIRQAVEAPTGADPTRSSLRLDGNANGKFVLFAHKQHQESMGGAASCPQCHHLNKPNDPDTACFHCHSDFMLSRSIFNHSLHERALGGNKACAQCHNLSLPESRDNSKPCADCHIKDMGMKPLAAGRKFNDLALGYKAAMHKLCVSCHQKKGAEMGYPELAECSTCHQ
jgi:Ni/Fe-hydrogenase subunit HybB-like protein